MRKLLTADWIPRRYERIEVLAAQIGPDELRTQLADGEIDAYAFHPKKGKLLPIHAANWYGEEGAAWIRGEGYDWPWFNATETVASLAVPILIFSRPTDLTIPADKLLASTNYLPPYLRLMIAVVRDLKITETSYPKKDEVVAELRKRADEMGIKLENAPAEAAGTFCRPIEAMVGGNKKRKPPASTD